MFPAPADPVIARADRAVSTVASGTDTGPGGDHQNKRWHQGSGRVGERPVESIAVYPPTRGVATQSDPFEPVKIGVLIDMDLGQLTADLMDPIILAAEDALNEGVYDRPVEIVTVDAAAVRNSSAWLTWSVGSATVYLMPFPPQARRPPHRARRPPPAGTPG